MTKIDLKPFSCDPCRRAYGRGEWGQGEWLRFKECVALGSRGLGVREGVRVRERRVHVMAL